MEIVNNNAKQNLKLIQFYAVWCAPCRALSPIVDSVSAKMEDRVEVLQIDIESDSDLVSEYQIRAVPTMILLKNDEPIWKHMGTIPETDLLTVLETYSKEQ